MQRNIRTVEPAAPTIPAKKRVAGYARVSGGKDAQLMSLSAQVGYYSAYIQKHPEWEYAGVYADEALTGTKDNRAEFQRMLSDCRAGKIDMVITKSISRFARNTVTMLESVRELRALGINVYFEKENIHSMSGDGELMLTILASYAQEESRSVSDNQKWRLRKQFASGRPGSTNALGYQWIDGKLYVIPEEAETVRLIFDLFLSGLGKNAIMKKLMEEGIAGKHGRRLTESGIAVILRNEKYVGDMLLQKSFVGDHLSKKKCINHGELPMYYVENSHEAIIGRDTFAKVQEELERRAAQYHPTKKTPTFYAFTGKIVCGGCGKNYRRKITAAGTKYEKPVWICATFNKLGKKYCSSQQIPEDILMELTASALGLSAFDEAVFKKKIARIVVPEPGRVTYVFENGGEIDERWKNPSRSLSWSEDMREEARRNAYGRRKKPCKQLQRQE